MPEKSYVITCGYCQKKVPIPVKLLKPGSIYSGFCPHCKKELIVPSDLEGQRGEVQ